MCDYASSSPYNLSHWPRGHVFGVGLSFKDYKLGKIPRAVKRFGEVIKKYFDIECDFHMVQSGDVCDDCDSESISFWSWIRGKKPEWSSKECKRVEKEIAKIIQDIRENKDDDKEENSEEEDSEKEESDEEDSKGEESETVIEEGSEEEEECKENNEEEEKESKEDNERMSKTETRRVK